MKAHKPLILLVSPPPINEVQLEANDLKNNQALSREQAVTARYADTVRSVVTEFNDPDVILIDLWTALMNEAQNLTPDYERGKLLGSKEVGDSEALRTLLCDGLHLTKKGYEIFIKEVLPHIGPEWKYEPYTEPLLVFP